MNTNQVLADAIMHQYLTLMRYQHRSSAIIQQQVQIPGRQVALLRFLNENGPCTVTEVSRFLYVREATASAMLDRMEQSGYITRSRCAEDNRKVIITPTARGIEIAQTAPLGMIALLRTRLPQQSADDLHTIGKGLELLLQLSDVDETMLD